MTCSFAISSQIIISVSLEPLADLFRETRATQMLELSKTSRANRASTNGSSRFDVDYSANSVGKSKLRTKENPFVVSTCNVDWMVTVAFDRPRHIACLPIRHRTCHSSLVVAVYSKGNGHCSPRSIRSHLLKIYRNLLVDKYPLVKELGSMHARDAHARFLDYAR